MTRQPGQGTRFPLVLMSLARATAKLFVQFLLPLLALGPLLYETEKLAELLGFHGDETQFLRMVALGVYALVTFTFVRFKTGRD